MYQINRFYSITNYKVSFFIWTFRIAKPTDILKTSFSRSIRKKKVLKSPFLNELRIQTFCFLTKFQIMKLCVNIQNVTGIILLVLLSIILSFPSSCQLFTVCLWCIIHPFVFTDLGDSLLKICCSSSSKLFQISERLA